MCEFLRMVPGTVCLAHHFISTSDSSSLHLSFSSVGFNIISVALGFFCVLVLKMEKKKKKANFLKADFMSDLWTSGHVIMETAHILVTH